MLNIAASDPRAVALAAAIRTGDVAALRQLLGEEPALAAARIVDERGTARSLLHIVADWPGHYPNGAQVVVLLAAAGAPLDARVERPAPETPLHWAASSDDVAVLDALLDAGADIEAPGSVIGGGTPLADAVAFGQWRVARRLVERGARTTLWQAAALGLMARVEEHLGGEPPCSPGEITNALWHACAGGSRQAAELLLARGADRNWVGWDGLTPLDVAERRGASELAAWLRERGARTAPAAT